MAEWKSWWDNPPQDRPLLVCVPGSTDHWYLVEWDYDEECFVDLNTREPSFEDGMLEECYLLPMWTELEESPSSICRDSIKNTHPNAFKGFTGQ